MVYRRFEGHPDEEFDYFLAEKLGMTVSALRCVMSNEEYLGWSVYYGRKAQRDELAAKEAKRGSR